MGIKSSFANWPVVLLSIEGDVETEVVDHWIQVLDEAIGHEKQHVLITDLTKVGEIPPTARKRIAEDIKTKYDLYQRYMLGNALISSSIMLRGVVTAISWLQDSAIPTKIFGSYEQAEQQAQKWLAARDIPWRQITTRFPL